MKLASRQFLNAQQKSNTTCSKISQFQPMANNNTEIALSSFSSAQPATEKAI